MLKDVIKGFFSSEEEREFEQLVRKFNSQAKFEIADYFDEATIFNTFPVYQEIIAKGKEYCKAFLFFLVVKPEKGIRVSFILAVISTFIQDEMLLWTNEDILDFVHKFKSLTKKKAHLFPYKVFLEYFSKYLIENGLDDNNIIALKALLYVPHPEYGLSQNQKKYNAKVEKLLNLKDFIVAKNEFLSEEFNQFLNSLANTKRIIGLIYLGFRKKQGCKRLLLKNLLVLLTKLL